MHSSGTLDTQVLTVLLVQNLCTSFAHIVHNLQAHYIEFLVQSADFFSATASLQSSLGG